MRTVIGIDPGPVRDRQPMPLLAEGAEQMRRPRLGVERRLDLHRRLRDHPRDTDLLGDGPMSRLLPLAALRHPSGMASGPASSSTATQASDGRPRAAAARGRIPQPAPIAATRARLDQVPGRNSGGIAIGAFSC